MKIKTFRVSVLIYVVCMLLGSIITLDIPGSSNEILYDTGVITWWGGVYLLNVVLWLVGLIGLYFLVSAARHLCVLSLAIDLFFVLPILERNRLMVLHISHILTVYLVVFITVILTIAYLGSISRYFKRSTALFVWITVLIISVSFVFLWANRARRVVTQEASFSLLDENDHSPIIIERHYYCLDMNEERYYSVKPSHLRNIARWEAWEEGEPPLSVGQMLTRLKNAIQTETMPSVASVTLRPFFSDRVGWEDERGMWYYSVDVIGQSGGRVMYIVLMDGSVISGRPN